MHGQYKRDLDKEVDMEKNMVVVKKRGLETRDWSTSVSRTRTSAKDKLCEVSYNFPISTL